MKAQREDFIRILSDYQGIIHKVNLIYFRTATDRQDNFQEVVYHLWRSFPALRNREKPASWIYSVAINTSITKIRKDSRISRDSPLPEIPDNGPVLQMENSMEFEKLMDALQKLNEVDRSIILLYLEGYPYDEISAITGITPGNVGVRINRCKTKLKTYLTGPDHEKK